MANATITHIIGDLVPLSFEGTTEICYTLPWVYPINPLFDVSTCDIKPTKFFTYNIYNHHTQALMELSSIRQNRDILYVLKATVFQIDTNLVMATNIVVVDMVSTAMNIYTSLYYTTDIIISFNIDRRRISHDGHRCKIKLSKNDAFKLSLKRTTHAYVSTPYAPIGCGNILRSNTMIHEQTSHNFIYHCAGYIVRSISGETYIKNVQIMRIAGRQR